MFKGSFKLEEYEYDYKPLLAVFLIDALSINNGFHRKFQIDISYYYMCIFICMHILVIFFDILTILSPFDVLHTIHYIL